MYKEHCEKGSNGEELWVIEKESGAVGMSTSRKKARELADRYEKYLAEKESNGE